MTLTCTACGAQLDPDSDDTHFDGVDPCCAGCCPECAAPVYDSGYDEGWYDHSVGRTTSHWWRRRLGRRR